MEVKYLKELHAMNKIALQIQDTLETKAKMTILEAQKESLIKVTVEMKSNLEANAYPNLFLRMC
mgnify:CR=1 FL=1